ncbi:glycoside hydrolase family 13 protein [Limibacter armeniacum]|uniref:glycoside hydrolase family 13 protein n=1 Tax=Limibacter armeniacum TaxID=466084 RepID=UPI002FE5C04D
MRHYKLLGAFLSLLMIGFHAHAKYEIDRVEPTFWWTGMKNQDLQLMIYGEKISDLKPEVSYQGVTLKQAISVESPNYLFLDLHISPETNPGKFDILFKDVKGKTVKRYAYELKERSQKGEEYKGFDNSDVMYLITPDRFVNGNPDNDNVAGLKEQSDRNFKGGRHGGDIQGIINSLDYIKDMGFTAIWVNPVLENDQETYSYHGYSTTDFYRVDPRFGTNEEYKQLSDQAASKDIKLIMDMILNHCGSEHWWMKDLPSSDWLNYQEGEFVQTNHKKAAILDPYASKIDKEKYFDGWFVKTMPDLNQRNPLMANYLIQNTIWWVEYLNLAGIRMDTYSYPDMDFMAEWTRRVMEEYPNFNIVGEEWSENPALVSYWQKGKENFNGYVSYLPSLMDFPLQGALKKSLQREAVQAYNGGLNTVYEMLANDFLYADPFNLVIFPDNHDMDRFFTQVNGDVGLFKMGVAYVLTMRGIPQLYYGTEVLMQNEGHPGDHGIIRTDFPGGWEGDKVNAFTGEGLSGEQKDAKEFVKRLLNWRKDNKAVQEGKLTHYAPENNDIYVYFRYNADEKVMVVLNKSKNNQTLKLDRFSQLLEGVTQGKDVISGKSFDMKDSIELTADSPMVLELK